MSLSCVKVPIYTYKRKPHSVFAHQIVFQLPISVLFPLGRWVVSRPTIAKFGNGYQVFEQRAKAQGCQCAIPCSQKAPDTHSLTHKVKTLGQKNTSENQHMRWGSESHPSLPNWELVIPGFYTKLVNQPAHQPANPQGWWQCECLREDRTTHVATKKFQTEFLQAHYRFNTNQPIAGPLMMGQSGYGHYWWALMGWADGHYGWALIGGLWWGLKLQSSLKMTDNNCGSSSSYNNNNSSGTKTYLSSSARQRQPTSSSNGNNTKSIRNSSYLCVCHFCCAVFATVFFCLLPPNHSFARASAPTLSLSLSLFRNFWRIWCT